MLAGLVADAEAASAPNGSRIGAGGAKVKISVTICAPVEDVWASVEEISSHVKWMKDAESVTFRTAQHKQVGAVFECVTRIDPIRLLDVMSVT
jgi:uncharacterized membrane protein